ncbi:MAG: ribosome biogenesis GTPase YqeH [Firmicutes bacterium]|nr:ribosome biogenesis GTPase YqeH [Bacillota bacterium]
MTELYCKGCGALIQTIDKTLPGFVSETMTDSFEQKNLLCQRCYRIRHYSDIITYSLSNDDYLNVINKISKENALIVKIVDIFDFSGSFVPAIKRLTGNEDVILVGNKMDLLPKNVKPERILNWLKQMLASEGFSVLDSILISAKYGNNFDDLMAIIEKHKGKRNVYIVGSTNVGKSKIINQILKRYLGSPADVVTVSSSPGTTIGLVGFPLLDGTMIFDTPGVINKHQYTHYLTRPSYKLTVPKKEVKPLVFQLNEGQTLFFGGLARLDIINGETGDKVNVVTYFANTLNIHRTKTIRADELYETKLYSLLTPPFNEDEAVPKWVFHEFKIRDNSKYDIVFSGLGFVTIRAPFYVRAFAPFVVGVYSRPAII